MNEDLRSLLLTTTGSASLTRTMDPHPRAIPKEIQELQQRYIQLANEGKVNWTFHLRFHKKLGSGGQGVVYLSERKGADQFTLPLAMKIFSPERYESLDDYDSSMMRIAKISSKVARIQNDHLVQVQDFVDRNRIRLMIMEWVEGYDLRRLLAPTMLARVKETVSEKRWRYINDVLVTHGEVQPRFKPGVAVSIVRDCLDALAALHRIGIIHGDIKPANIMLKRSGHAKIIDIGSAVDIQDIPSKRACTPSYAALEVLEGGVCTPLSDLASLGFVLIELLAGKPIFSLAQTLHELIELKRTLPYRLNSMLPHEVTVNGLLMSFCKHLIASDPADRFVSAEAATLTEDGAAEFHRQLIKNDMASEYGNDIRIWIEELLEMDGSLFDDD